MIAVSGGLMFIGYQLMVYGFSQVRGQNAGFFDILWPGRYKGNTPDKSAADTYSPSTGLNNTAAGGTVGATPARPLRQPTNPTPAG
jgi:hypothetical protein